MTARLLREEARLRALFRRLVAASVAVAPLAGAGCSSGDDSSSAKDAAAQANADATMGGSPGVDAAGDATIAPASDGGDEGNAPHDAACDPVYVDGASDGACDYFESLACNLPPGTLTEGCAIELVTCAQICGQTAAYPCQVSECVESGVIPSGPVTVECQTGMAGCADAGRRPSGLVEATAPTSDGSVGAWLATLAWSEGASVHAFRALREELEGLGAPASLARAAQRAERDEVRHARLASRLARRRGAAPCRVRVAPRARPRSLESFARENAVEGCVREAFAALVAAWQAHHAPDTEIAAAMNSIAEDELRHGALAWAVASWAEGRLDPAANGRVRASLRGAVRALRCEVRAIPPALARAAGLPHGAAGASLVDAFASALLA
jgi:hypothetical protein